MNRDLQSIPPKARIAIIGGGIAGATVALCLTELGVDVTLIEKGPTLVNGPPICHLHAGGNLYREISESQCTTLLRESIDLLRLYPNAVDYRPTVIAVPNNDNGEAQDLLPRLKNLQAEYQHLIDKDANNAVLGAPEEYFQLFSREQVEVLKRLPPVKKPKSSTDWLIPIAHYVDLDQLKFPIILVQEYGLNLFRLGASAQLALRKIENCLLLTDTTVTAIQSSGDRWKIDYQHDDINDCAEFDYLINAAGFRSGLVDDMLGFERQRFVEFKAAYVTKWPACNTIWPEVIFFGERGTPNGMAQFTPYPDGYFQLHGMTQSITLFDNGLVESSKQSAQPQLNDAFINKIDKGWPAEEITLRSQNAIDHLRRFIPQFSSSATVSAKPLFGAQQIPGESAELRAAGVSFVGKTYARCEIVKASSALSVADEIIKQLVALGYLNKSVLGARDFNITSSISDAEIEEYAQYICKLRDYPISLASCNISKQD